MGLKKSFISFLMQRGALSFGDFTLKSGRKSPYFFNAGSFNTAQALSGLGEYYARLLYDSLGETKPDTVFGPAYKGIPLSIATAMAYSRMHNHDLCWLFDRKEAKEHGDKGGFVGRLGDKKNVVIVDDVITTGATKVRVIEKLTEIDPNVNVLMVLIALDRCEGGVEEFVQLTDIPARSIVDAYDILDHLGDFEAKEEYLAMKAYLDQWGTKK